VKERFRAAIGDAHKKPVDEMPLQIGCFAQQGKP